MTMPLALRDPRTMLAQELMLKFSERTGLSGRHAPRRYLWTDAFAVCNFLGLARATGRPRYGELAGELVAQVHHVLGKHRANGSRSGWISGLPDAEAEQHPTAGGLRIGKPFDERPPGEPLIEKLEWDRDGQYFHYLTKWMLALERFALATLDEQPLVWARELASKAYHAFTRDGRMVWKMSIDLSRPLVDTMGQHDPLDGLVTCLELDAAARALDATMFPFLDAPIAAYTTMLDRHDLVTADPLGLGGLFIDAARLAHIAPQSQLVAQMLDAAVTGLEFYAALHDDRLPAARRLPFRELGLAIGLAALARMDRRALSAEARNACARLEHRADLARTIEAFWSRPEHRTDRSWSDQADINDVMLATCLCPDGLLDPPRVA